MDTNNVVIGARNAWGRDEVFSISGKDRRQHLFILGKSGTGKSTLIFNLVMQDIRAGRGVAVIDPHGDLVTEILAHLPRGRTEDVVLFDPSDTEYPLGLNLLYGVPPARRHLVVSGVVAVFKAIWPEFFGPRMENILSHAVATLLECQNVSLLGLQRMLTDDGYRRWAVRQVKDPLVRAFWEREFEAFGEKTRAEFVAPILNKVGALLLSPQVRNILGQVRSRIDAREIMDEGKVFLANLSKGRIGPDKANLLGSLWVTQFHLAAMSRADTPESERKDFFCYIDEWQSFVSESFVSALAESRKYRLCLTLANQYLGQLKETIRQAVFGNVGSMVAFRVGHEDALTLEQSFGRSFAASEFSSLSNGEVYAKILTNGQDMEPFPARTFRPQGQAHKRSRKIIDRAREQYAVSREKVEARIKRWLGDFQT